jgi:hypothetical protein
MKKSVTFLFCVLMIIAALGFVWAGEQYKSQQPGSACNKVAAQPIEKQSLSTDLGKGMPYPGLSEQEKAKIEETTKAQSAIKLTTSNPVPPKSAEIKPTPVSNSRNSSSPKIESVTPPSKPEKLTTDSGNGTPYPGLSTQEEKKLQDEGGR